MRRRVLLAPVALVAASFALTGCQPGLLAVDDTPRPITPSETSGAAPSSSPSGPATDPSASPSSEGEPADTPSQAPVEGGTAIDFSCQQVLSLEQLYDFDPNFTPADEAGRQLPQAFGAFADDGIVCAYRHVTSEAVLLVAVAPADSGADAGYTNEVGIGTTVAASASGDWLLAIGSTYFGDAGDAAGLLEQVSGNVDS